MRRLQGGIPYEVMQAQSRVPAKHVGKAEEPLDLDTKMCCHSLRTVAEYVSENEKSYPLESQV